MPLRLVPALPARPSPKSGRGERRPAMVRRQPPCRPSLVALLSSFRTAPFVPRGALRASASRPSCSHRLRRGAGGAPTGALVSSIALARRDQPRLRGTDRPVATGTPSRRSTVAIFGRGPTLSSPAVEPAPTSDLPAAGPKARRAGSQTSRAAVSRRSRGTPRLAPPAGSSPETPLMSEDTNLVYHKFVT